MGKNLRDHPLVPVRVKVKDDFPLDPDAPRIQTVLRYTAGGSDARNDMQIFPSSFSTPLGGDPFDNEGIRLTCMMELAESAGELTLQSTDPDVQPHIDCRYLEADWDRERMREAVRIVLRLLDHEQFSGIYDGLISPTAEDLVSDEALDDWMLREVCIGQHLSGTCKMGPGQRCDGSGGPVLSRPWHRQPAGGGRIRNARRHSRQHQLHDHHDRRAGRRMDSDQPVAGSSQVFQSHLGYPDAFELRLPKAVRRYFRRGDHGGDGVADGLGVWRCHGTGGHRPACTARLWSASARRCSEERRRELHTLPRRWQWR